MRLGVEFDQRRRVRDRDEALVLRVKREVLGPRGRLLLVIHRAAVGDRALFADLFSGGDFFDGLHGGGVLLHRSRSWSWRSFSFLDVGDLLVQTINGLLHLLDRLLELLEFFGGLCSRGGRCAHSQDCGHGRDAAY